MTKTFATGPAIDTATGLMLGVRQVLSPHHDARPAATNPELIVVHGISLPPGEYGGPYIEQLFTGNLRSDDHPYFATLAGVRVSAHLLIRRDGRVLQFVPFQMRAWHAGESDWCGRAACNDFSIGIELEGTDDQPYTPQQYPSLAACIKALCTAYPSLATERVVGHSDIAPGRKTDPGESFDWPRLRQLINGAAGPAVVRHSQQEDD
jgi:AmpD protein